MGKRIMGDRREKRMENMGINRNKLRLLGLVLLALGMMGRGILETRVLGVSTGTTQQLLQVLDMEGGMTAAAVALVFEAMESCAVPVFAVLTLDGFLHTGNFRNYLLRVIGLAVVSEIPYNYAMSGQLLEPTTRNPVFGLALCLVMLYLYQYYQGSQLGKMLIKLVVCAASLLWALLFGIRYGCILLILVNVLWVFRDRPSLRSFLGAAAAVCCCVVNPLYMFTPFGFLAAHLYNGEEGIPMGRLPYIMYPLMLILTGAAGYLLF